MRCLCEEKEESGEQRGRSSHYDMIENVVNEPWQQCGELNAERE